MKRSAQEIFEKVIDLPESERQAELDSNGKALELLSVLKDIRTTGATASISGISDQELANDLQMLQGKWRHKGWERGQFVEHMIVEINGTQSETRFLDEDGKTIRGRKSRLELSRSGGVKVFKSFQGESPDIGGAFVYEVRQHRLTLVSGLLQNEESLPEIKLRHFFRMKPGETDSGAIKEVPTSLTFDIENGLVTDVDWAEFRHFYGTESIAKQVDWLLSLPTPVTHLKLNSDGLIEANVFEEVSRLDQLQDLWIESYAKYTDKEVQPLARMPHLKELTFKESIVTPGACREILNVKSLKTFRIPQLSEELQAEMNSHRPDLSAHGHNNYEP